MTKQEAFKIGFLMKCAEEGLTPKETEERIKRAHAMVKMANWKDMLARIAKYGLGIGLIAPPVLGGIGGYALAQGHERPYSKAMARKDEELAEYYRAIDQLERARRQREAAAA
jgi:hypothetical protein